MPNQEQPLFAQSQVKIPPQNNEIEITLFGKGVGESILVHFGDGHYAVIDSFINPDTKNPIVLDYLEAIGVSPDRIDIVISTHWHADHTAGLSAILSKASPSVKFITYPIIAEDKFNQYLEAGKKVDEKNMSTTQEFATILDKCVSQKIKIEYALHNQLLHKVAKNKLSHNNEVDFFALSPQHKELQDYLLKLNLPSEKTISYSFPYDNDISIVIWLNIGGNIILLGGDLENKSNDNSTGWCALLNEHSFCEKADLFKVPHHGSASAHNDEIWSKLLKHKPISIMSVFSRGTSPQPQQSDKDRIKDLSSQTFIAGATQQKVKIPIKLPKGIDVKLKVLPTTIGIVRARKTLIKRSWWQHIWSYIFKNKTCTQWNIEKFGTVEKL